MIVHQLPTKSSLKYCSSFLYLFSLFPIIILVINIISRGSMTTLNLSFILIYLLVLTAGYF